jgi:hypothetical protein
VDYIGLPPKSMMGQQQEKSRERPGGDGEALRKHREKRRARPSGNKTSKDGGERSSTIKDAPQKSSEEYFIPEEQILATIVTTDTSHERMRKISILGLEDPADMVRPKQPTAGSKASKRETSSRPISSRAHNRTNKVHPEKSKSDVDASKLQRVAARGNARSEKAPAREKMRRTKSNDTKEFRPPMMLMELLEEPQGHESTRSLDEDRLLLDMQLDFTPTPEIKRRSRSLDDEGCLLDLQLSVPQNEKVEPGGYVPAGPRAAPKGPRDIGFIEPTKQQRQLMRKISALGLEDPVFGNIHEELRPRHASNIFEDMDFADVPEDMRDMLSLASDHTDPVGGEDYILESPVQDWSETKQSAALTSSSRSLRHQTNSAEISPGDKRGNFVPPVGSFVRKSSSNRHLDVEITMDSPAVSPTHNTPRSAIAKSAKSDRSRSTKNSSETGNGSSPSPYSFIPPSGSFNARKPRKDQPATPTGDVVNPKNHALLREIELATTAESMYPDLCGGSLSNLNASFSNRNNSLSSMNFNISLSSLNDSFNSTGISSKPKSSRISTTKPPLSKVVRRSSNYTPPPAPLEAVPSPANDSSHRALPSVDSIFSIHMDTTRNSRLHQTDRSEKEKESPKPPIDRKRHFQKTPSSRSWEGDLNVDDPMGRPSDPMWASLSQLDFKPKLSKDGSGNHAKASFRTTSSPDNTAVGVSSQSSANKRKSRKQKTGRRSSQAKDSVVTSESLLAETAVH